MFLNYIKNFWLNKLLINKLYQSKPSTLNTTIQSVGLLIDASNFEFKEQLLSELVANGINEQKVSVLIYLDKVKKNEVFNYPTFSFNQLNWKGDFTTTIVQDFVQTKFDLLISYYETEKIPLLLITSQSKAQFKAGFSVIDKRLNHLMITTQVENFKVFAHELIRYLKILNKI